MDSNSSNSPSQDEVNLYDYWKVIVKRKWLLAGIIFITVFATTIVNFIFPKIYRGEYIVKMATGGFTDILSRINENGNTDRETMLPKTHNEVYEIIITPTSDSLQYKLQIWIDVKDTSYIEPIAKELLGYINDFPFYKRSVTQSKERLEKQLEELTIAITNSEEMLKTYNTLLKGEKLVPLGFNPIESYNGIFELKTKKVMVEQSLQNINSAEIITKYIFSYPVKPQIKRNIILSALIGIITGILFVFIAEFAEKIRTRAGNKSDE